jgi:hypothetical protein
MGYTRKIDISAAAGIKNKKTLILSIEIPLVLILLNDFIIPIPLFTFYILLRGLGL